jgi:hypothetical protein
MQGEVGSQRGLGDVGAQFGLADYDRDLKMWFQMKPGVAASMDLGSISCEPSASFTSHNTNAPVHE